MMTQTLPAAVLVLAMIASPVPAAEPLPLSRNYRWGPTAALSPDGKQIAVGDLTGRLDLWDARTGKLQRNLQPGLGVTQQSDVGITVLAFSPDGKTLATGCRDGATRLWEIATGKVVRTLAASKADTPGRDNHNCCVAFIPDGTRLLVASRQTGLRLWELPTGKVVWSLSMPGVRAALSPDGQTLATGDWRDIAFRDASTGRLRKALRIESTGRPNQGSTIGQATTSIAFAPDGKLVASSHYDGTVRLWDVTRQTEVKRLFADDRNALAVRFSASGQWLASSGADGTIHIWETATGKEAHRIRGSVGELAFSPHSRRIFATNNATVLQFDARPSHPMAGGLVAWWEALRSDNAAVAYRAVWALAEHPNGAAFLRDRLNPPAADRARLTKLIAELDSDQFAVREAASKALADLGPRAELAMREALKRSPSVEAKHRLKRLLELSGASSADGLRRLRAMHALELASR